MVDDDEYEMYLEDLNKKMSNPRGFLFSLPFVILSMISIFLFVMPTMPNPLFPVDPMSLVWLYLSVENSAESCFHCLELPSGSV